MGGSGSRFGSPLPKQFCRLIGVTPESPQIPLFAETLQTFLNEIDFDVVVLAVHSDYMQAVEFTEPLQWLKQRFPVEWVITSGGDSRHHSFRKAFSELSRQIHKDRQVDTFRVVVHDANRPFLTSDFLQRVAAELGGLSQERPALIPVIPMADSVVKIKNDLVQEYSCREELGRVQTPQLFWGPVMAQALGEAQEGFDYPDEGSFMLGQGFAVHTFPGDIKNRKITYRDEVEMI